VATLVAQAHKVTEKAIQVVVVQVRTLFIRVVIRLQQVVVSTLVGVVVERVQVVVRELVHQ
jgi:hypothetical protein